VTDAHCHVSAGDPTIRELLIGRDFVGIHPWETLAPDFDLEARLAEVERRLRSTEDVGVGETGLDRLKVRDISDTMREAFIRQLELAVELQRPVVLHGAKCWGQVVMEVRSKKEEVRSGFLFHGFSRSDGLIPDIVRLGGYISVGPAILNDHAVNYRDMVKKIPRDRLLIETDRDDAAKATPTIQEVAAGLAKVLGMSVAELESVTDENVERFING